MTGSRLEVNVHVVTGSSSSMQNMIACVNRAGVEVVDTVLEQLAASEAVLTPDEKELGVALVDIGGGTTDFAVFERGSLWHTGVLPVGGDHFTNDIAVGLRMPIPDAEKLKRRSGCALTSLVPEDETMEVASIAGRRARVDAAAGAVGDPAAARRRDLPPVLGRDSPRRLREVAQLRHRPHRRRRACSRAWPRSPNRFSTCRCAARRPKASAVSPITSTIRRSRRRSASCVYTHRNLQLEPARIGAGALGRITGRLRTLFKEFF